MLFPKITTPHFSSMSLPTHTSDGNWLCQKESISRQYKFLRRVFKLKFNQMDFQFAAWQMLYLLTTPSRVYKNSQIRKHTKDQWARDDPAFTVLLAGFLAISSVLFAVILKLSVPGFFQFLLWVIFIDFIGVGLVIAGICWYACSYLTKSDGKGQLVEFGYSFDVHCNAFFPVLVIMHVLQPLCWHIFIDGDTRLATFLGNSLWVLAIASYIYITFLGYAALPYIRGSEKLLYSVVGLAVVFVISVILNNNWGRHLINFYRFRIGE